MPPTNQGSRGAMIAWIVVCSIAGVVGTIFAVYAYVEINRVNERLADVEKQYTKVVTRDMLNSEELTKLTAAKDDPNAASMGINSSMTLLDVALAQRGHMSKLIGGREDEAAAFAAAPIAIEKAKAAGVKPAGDSLIATIDALITDLDARKTEVANLSKDAKAARDAQKQIADATEAQVKSLTTTMEQIRAEKDAIAQQAQERGKEQIAGFENTAEGLRKQLQVAQEQINQVNTQNTELNNKIKTLDITIVQLQTKLGERRLDPAKAIVRQPDGKIISVPTSEICFIDLGVGDQISPGLTFEVYDKVEGIPQPGDPSTDENLPVGKASLEVIRVSSTSSQCRVTRRALGAVLSQGDLIVNLVYDRNTKYNFVVHGNFDMSNRGANPQDAEMIKQLITSWGGNVVDKIDANTDFVVLGREPETPEKPADPNDPVAVKKYEDDLAAYEKYGEVSTTARSYRIPILNQNRFLYLTGYFDQAKRR